MAQEVIKPVLGYLDRLKKVYADHAYKVDLGNAKGIPLGLAGYIIFRY